MQKFTATFKSGAQIVKTSEHGFKNRLDVLNWICDNRLGKRFGSVVSIDVSILPD